MNPNPRIYILSKLMIWASPPLVKSKEEEDEGRWAKSLAIDGHEKGRGFFNHPNGDVPGRLLAGNGTGRLSPLNHPF